MVNKDFGIPDEQGSPQARRPQAGAGRQQAGRPQAGAGRQQAGRPQGGRPQAGSPAPKKNREEARPESSEHPEKQPKPTDAGSDEGAAAGAANTAEEFAEEFAAELEDLDELAKALAEATELKDRYLRLKAEWDNYRKRTEAERSDERSRATQRLVEKLLPILDDLERAIEHSDTTQAETMQYGITQVYSKMQDVLASEGVQTIDPKGEPFDANCHCAISKVEDKKVPEETVLEVFQKGYAMGGRVLRPASVVISHQ